MNLISNENWETKMVITAEEEHEKSLSKPVHICITNAASPVAYQMINEIARGIVTQISLYSTQGNYATQESSDMCHLMPPWHLPEWRERMSWQLYTAAVQV